MSKTNRRNLRKFVDKGTEFITIGDSDSSTAKNKDKKKDLEDDDKQDGLGYIKI